MLSTGLHFASESTAPLLVKVLHKPRGVTDSEGEQLGIGTENDVRACGDLLRGR
jgi:hypothetical protein